MSDSLIELTADEIEFLVRRDTGIGSTSTPATAHAIRRPSFRCPDDMEDFLPPPSDRLPDHEPPLSEDSRRLLGEAAAQRAAAEAQLLEMEQSLVELERSLLEERGKTRDLEELLHNCLATQEVGRVRLGPALGRVQLGPAPLGRVQLGPAPQATQVVDVIVNKDSSTYQHRAATLKLEKYNGTTPLETFLAKLDNCREYYGWSEKDTVHHLRACLEGSAGQVLVECAGQNSLDEIVDLLKTRFGCLNQTERFRAELRTRRRAHGETLQSVYTDIRRLVALSFLEQQRSVYEIVARDAFLAAINNPSFVVEFWSAIRR
ncbi:MAG TPA: hypothetical protein VLS45_08845, partial [Methylomicrobium sp.]|nr:hypothetical protein [Methylomicrobium sp.]